MRDEIGPLLQEVLARQADHARYPVRQKSAKGLPKPTTSIERTCRKCGASFLGLAAGKTGEVGIWNDMAWLCSVECAPPKIRAGVRCYGHSRADIGTPMTGGQETQK